MIRKCLGLRLSLIAAVCSFPVAGLAQQPAAAAASTLNTSTGTVVPKLVNYNGTLTDLNGKPLSGVAGVTFFLYKDSQGGAPLWMETQNVQAAKGGAYSVLLGSTSSQGLPEEVFVSGEARWLGVQVLGQPEQPRVLLVAVPYALKARDAETIGGLPPSAFMLAPAVSSGSPAPRADASASSAPLPNPAVTGAGTASQIPLWDTTSDIVNSAMTQTGTGSTARIGINTATPATTLDVKGPSTFRGQIGLPSSGPATATNGKSSYPLILTGTAFNSGTGTSVNQTFRWQTEPVGNNSTSTSGKLNLLFYSGSNTPAETGLSIASNGQMTFAAGQTFPGTGAITGVTAGTGLTGGGSTGNVTLNLDTTKVPLLNTANNFTGNQSVAGNITASGIVTGTVFNASTEFDLGGTRFLSGSNSTDSAFLGFSGNTTSTGLENSALGFLALANNAAGFNNAAIGSGALLGNTGGNYNTAIGQGALGNNTAGSNNTAIGSGAGPDSSHPNLGNATAIGANAVVSESNALVLGGTGGNAVNVGIGTATPAATLDVKGTGSFSGLVTFAAGQTFPGAGTVTSVGSGAGLTGGPITGAGSLSIATGGVTDAMLANPSLTITATSPLSGGGAVALGGTTTLGLTNCTVSGQVLKWDRAWGCATDANSGGTVTSVASGTGLLGGPITTSGTLSVNPAVVAELAQANTFINFQTITAGGRGVPLTVNNTSNTTATLSLTGGYYGLVASNQVFPITVNTTVGPEAIYAASNGTNIHDSGVLGATFGASGILYGLFGVNNNSPDGAGVYGQATDANSNTGSNWPFTGAGVWGDAGLNSTAYAAVLGTSDAQSAGAFFNNGTGFFTLYAEAGNANGYPFGAYNTSSGSNQGCGIDPLGNLTCTGSKSVVVPIDGGQRRVALSAIESPKNWFEDFGSEHLSNGVAVIHLEGDFAQTVNTRTEYHVFLTPNEDCKGLYVTHKTATSFEVRELGGGKSNVAFDYRVVALRKDYENIRLADHTHDPQPSKMRPVAAGARPNAVDVKTMIPPNAQSAAHLGAPTLN